MSGKPKREARKRAGTMAASAVVRYAKQVHRYFLRRLSRTQDVDDLAQEVYLRILRLDDRPWMEDALPYLYTVAAHVLADFRQDAVQEERYITVDSEAVDQLLEMPQSFSPDELAEALDLQRQLDRALAQLKPRHQQILLLHKRDGYSYEEIAEKLGLSVDTVHKYLTQARAQIRATAWDK